MHGKIAHPHAVATEVGPRAEWYAPGILRGLLRGRAGRGPTLAEQIAEGPKSYSYLLYVAAKPRRVGQNLCRKQLASTFLDPKIAKESISVIESCHRSRADALQGHFQPTSISNRQQPDHACINFCLSHSENSVQMHACMICRSEFSPEWLNQRMHGHRPARIRSGGCMTGNRKIMQK